MAFANTSLLKNPTVLEQLLEEINFQRKKEMRQLLKDDSGFVMLQGTTYWTDLFVRHFLFQNESTIDCDDLLFFVRKKHVKNSSKYLPKFETEVDVFRKDSRKLPIGDPDIDWEETVYLNLIIHQFDYTLTLAICTRTSPKELQVLRRHSQKVYASPSRRRMDTKGELEEMTYPHICFMVDNFDEVFCDILVRDGEMVCVELVASDRKGAIQSVIFLGSIRYDALKKVYDARQSSLSSKMAQRMTFGLFSGSAAQRCEFVRMKGPQGKGHAEMAVTKPKGSGVETPTSEPGCCMTDMWELDWDTDPDEWYAAKMQRRLSDPSSNLNNFVRRGPGRLSDGLTARARSENEGLDSMDTGVSEVEAGDVKDDTDAPHASSSQRSKLCCAPCIRPRVSTPAVSFNDLLQRAATNDDLEIADDAISLNGAESTQTSELNPDSVVTVNGKEELPGLRESNAVDKDIEMKNSGEYDSNRNRRRRRWLIRPGRRRTAAGTTLGENMEGCVSENVTKTGKKADETINKALNDSLSLGKNTTENIRCKVTEDVTRLMTGSVHAGKNLNEGLGKNINRNLERSVVKSGCIRGNLGTRLSKIPHRVTPDGTDIYYWCDIPKTGAFGCTRVYRLEGCNRAMCLSVSELDDGQYNPLWTMRGFTQTFHFWKENKRAQSVPLNAFLTYVTLPWWSIAKDILDHREGPILTF